MGDDLVTVSAVQGVTHGHLAEPQQASETCIDHGKDEHVVMIARFV